MEVGRVGDLGIRDGSIVRLPLVGDRLYECHDQKKDLTGAGLLMEVARDTPGVRFWAPIGRYRRFASTETEKGDFVYSPSGFRIAKYCRVSGRKRTQAIPTKIVK